MSKLKMWQENHSWNDAEKKWDDGALLAATQIEIKKLNKMPSMEGITKETAKNLRWKSLKWMIKKDHDFKIVKSFLRNPIKYGISLIKSLFKKKPYIREGDLFLCGISSVAEFEKLVENQENLFVVGFSYCHKPFECPSGRFTDLCVHDPENPICRQCFIGKCVNALPEKNVFPLFIPTIHYIGGKILDLIKLYPNKKIVFLITACEMSLNMFADLGNMAKIQGIGVRLDGRICNTMKAFELSEEGIKPGLTVVLEPTKKIFLEFIRHRREFAK